MGAIELNQKQPIPVLVRYSESSIFADLKIVCKHTILVFHLAQPIQMIMKNYKIVGNKKAFPIGKAYARVVVMDGIEPPTQGFSVLCSTN